ncbi:MAG: hypothetical protein EZS28_015773 [Streblomastix strix]|uniref:Uncharacterized protein n=1 Tax=Streblomastix strix TaxID=222440 RepID=A0A5J4W1J1_9EUKA|nr:MAG: hypothetical protein EZS28_015773 [Streblomastix strix]
MWIGPKLAENVTPTGFGYADRFDYANRLQLRRPARPAYKRVNVPHCTLSVKGEIYHRFAEVVGDPPKFLNGFLKQDSPAHIPSEAFLMELKDNDDDENYDYEEDNRDVDDNELDDRFGVVAIDRCHRIGQKKEFTIYRLIYRIVIQQSKLFGMNRFDEEEAKLTESEKIEENEQDQEQEMKQDEMNLLEREGEMNEKLNKEQNNGQKQLTQKQKKLNQALLANLRIYNCVATSSKNLAKQDLLTMIRHGANEILNDKNYE